MTIQADEIPRASFLTAANLKQLIKHLAVRLNRSSIAVRNEISRTLPEPFANLAGLEGTLLPASIDQVLACQAIARNLIHLIEDQDGGGLSFKYHKSGCPSGMTGFHMFALTKRCQTRLGIQPKTADELAGKASKYVREALFSFADSLQYRQQFVMEMHQLLDPEVYREDHQKEPPRWMKSGLAIYDYDFEYDHRGGYLYQPPEQSQREENLRVLWAAVTELKMPRRAPGAEARVVEAIKECLFLESPSMQIFPSALRRLGITHCISCYGFNGG